MKLSIDSLRASGGFTGAPVKREIEWVKDGETLKFDVYVRRMGYQTAITDFISGDIAANRIAHCICDEQGAPTFKVPDITGINEDGTPVLDDEGKERGALDSDLTKALLFVIGDVNGLGKAEADDLAKEEEIWHELVLCGVGGCTIAQAKDNISYPEFVQWCQFRNKYGSLHFGMRLDRAVSRAATLCANIMAHKHIWEELDLSPYDVAIREAEKPVPTAEQGLAEIMAAFKSKKE